MLTMCFEFDAVPPDVPADLLRPIGGAAGHELLELTSADGTAFSAALTEAADPAGPAVVILPDVRGLYRFYAELTERFAQAGHHAIAIDYFGRTAGTGLRGEDFDYQPHREQTRPKDIQADTIAARAALEDRTGAAAVVSVGFCFGGTNSLMAATDPELDLQGAVAFYSALDRGRLGDRSPLNHTGEVRCPVLGLFGGADAAIPPDQVAELDQGLADAGVAHEIVTYPGAPHSFFDRRYEEHAEACEDAWRRVLSFLNTIGG
jgi:carboxymethylenebutenolidase